jgi:heptosyltransferase-2
MERSINKGRTGAGIGAGALARLALALRYRLFVPGGPLEGFYQRFVRPRGQRLLPRPGPGLLGRVMAWPSPVIAADRVATLLLVKLDHIGDFLLAAPAFALLRRSFPNARITLLCGPWNVALAERSGWFDTVVPLYFFAPRAEEVRPAMDPAVVTRLGVFDLAIDLRVDEDTRPVLMQARARLKAGYQARGAAGLAVALPRPPGDPAARADLQQHRRQLLLNLVAAVLGQDPGDETGALVRRMAAPMAEMSGWARPVVAMSTGSGRAIKNWPLARFIALAHRLRAERGGTLVLLGGAEQIADAAAIRAALGGAGVIDLVGQLPIEGSFGVLAAADAFVGNDTALGHASAALGKPTVVVFSGIDPLPEWAPLGPQAVAIKAEITCSPCHLSELSRCPNGHLCMTGIGDDTVWAQLSLALAGPRVEVLNR